MFNVIKIAEQVKGSCTGCYYRGNQGNCNHPDGVQDSECNSTRTIYVQAPTSRATDPATSKGKRKVNKYEQAVLDILRGLYKGQGYTGKQIASLTGHPLNCITPRFAPLRRKGLIAPLYSEGYGHPVVKRDKQIVWVLA